MWATMGRFKPDTPREKHSEQITIHMPPSVYKEIADLFVALGYAKKNNFYLHLVDVGIKRARVEAAAKANKQ